MWVFVLDESRVSRRNIEQFFIDNKGVIVSSKIIRRSNKKALVVIHGNTVSSDIWLPVIDIFPETYDIVAPDLRGFGDSSKVTVDATKGMSDFADDVIALMRYLGYDEYVLVGHSMGGGVALQVLLDKPRNINVSKVILVDPMSPFGFGGTKDEKGTPCYEDYAGSGGGLVAKYNPDFPRLLREKYTGTDHPSSPVFTIKTLFADDFTPSEELVDSILNMMFKMNTNEYFYPGDYVDSPNWPYVAPGTKGVLNAMSPKYLRLHRVIDLEDKPPIIWIHGDKDTIISDASALDIAILGLMGYIPGYPGPLVYPPQPMLKQIEYILKLYSERGGSYEKYIVQGAGHTPFIEKPEDFHKIIQQTL
jgi:pimeloyl-ACP methyl ester carboxylesterase